MKNKTVMMSNDYYFQLFCPKNCQEAVKADHVLKLETPINLYVKSIELLSTNNS